MITTQSQRFRSALLLLTASVVSVSGVLYAAEAGAQGVSEGIGIGSNQRRDQDRRELEEQRERMRQLREALPEIEEPPRAPVAPKSGEPEVTFFLSKIALDESAILSEAEVAELTAGYEGSEVSLAQLKELIVKINLKYRQKGFPTARAYLPPQTIKDGVVKIQLVEARVGGISYEGAKHTRESYLQSRLKFERGDLVDVKDADRQLARFNRLQDVRVRLKLKPGETPGTTDYVLEVDEPRQYGLDLYTDNQGQESSGRDRFGATAFISSVLGLRDSIAFGGYTTDGVDSGFVSYTIPVNSRDTKLSLNVDFNDTVIENALGSLDLAGDGLGVGARLTHPVYVTAARVVRVFTGLSYRESELGVPTGGFTANFGSQSEFWDLQAGVQLEDVGEWGVTSVTQTISGVVDRLGNDFVKYEGSIVNERNLMPNLWTTLVSRWQFSTEENTPAATQFQIGGANTLRGYPEGFQSSDNGYQLSAQLNTQFPFDLFGDRVSGTESLRSYVFLDHGQVFSDGDSVDLTSVGLGSVLRVSNLVSLEGVAGVPLNDRADGDRVELHLNLHVYPPVDGWIETALERWAPWRESAG